VPTIGHLDRVRCAGSGALRVGTGSISTDHLHAGVLFQPVAEGLRLPIVEQIDRSAAVHVDEHGAVDAPATEREVVHPSTVGVSVVGSGAARTSRSRVERLTTMAARRAKRAPARPASANAIAVSNPNSCRLRRPCLTVRPASCSAKIRRTQPRVWQTNLRTRRRITTA